MASRAGVVVVRDVLVRRRKAASVAAVKGPDQVLITKGRLGFGGLGEGEEVARVRVRRWARVVRREPRWKGAMVVGFNRALRSCCRDRNSSTDVWVEE
jgi:hypothetical protein